VDPRANLVGVFTLLLQPVTESLDATYHSWITANRPYSCDLAGPPGGFGLMMIGNMGPPTPTPFGDMCIEPGTAAIVGLVHLSAPDGHHRWSMFCPAAAPSGFAFTFQALTLSPTGQFGVTIPSPALVAWEPGRAP